MTRLPTALIEAIERGDDAAVDEALAREPALAVASTADGDTLLHLACWQKQAKILELVLARAPDVNARGDRGRTPLHYAVQDADRRCVGIVAALLGHGADPKIADALGRTVETVARSEVWEALEEVLALLRGPLPIQPGIWRPLLGRGKAEHQRDLSFAFGPLRRAVSLRPYRKEGARVATSLSVPATGFAFGFDVWLPIADLEHFRGRLRALAGGAFGSAVLESSDGYGIRLEVRSDGRGGIKGAWSTREAGGPPGFGDGQPPREEFPFAPPEVAALVAALDLACAELASWPP
ncbi:MAG TPA: ankyrin repeat domain-containing protein [Labilithrix sp.]|nr:ankyrin repeat domain-containing protein [Labilithrix sp.]